MGVVHRIAFYVNIVSYLFMVFLIERFFVVVDVDGIFIFFINTVKFAPISHHCMHPRN